MKPSNPKPAPRKTIEQLSYEMAEFVMNHPQITEPERLKIQNQWTRINNHQEYAEKNPGERQELRVERLGLLRKVYVLMFDTYYRCIKREPVQEVPVKKGGVEDAGSKAEKET